jgi:hypothetical protein
MNPNHWPCDGKILPLHPEQQDVGAHDLQALQDGSPLHFDFEGDVLTPDSRARPCALAGTLRDSLGLTPLISGQTDEPGTPAWTGR